jgi:hypothetical protein
MCRWQFYSRRRRKHFLLFFTNKIHSYFFYSYTDARVEATNRINKRERERDRVYARVLSSVYDSRVNEILIWQKNLKSFQHENIHFLPNTISIFFALFPRSSILLEMILLEIFNQADCICKRRWQLYYWYSMRSILNDDVISSLNKKIIAHDVYWIHKIIKTKTISFVFFAEFSHDYEVCFIRQK